MAPLLQEQIFYGIIMSMSVNKTDEELMELLDDLIARDKTDQHTKLSHDEKYRLRYLEWKNRKYTKGFREDFKNIDVDRVIAMRHDQLMTDTEISRALGSDNRIIGKLIGFFGIQVDEDRKDEFAKHKKAFLSEEFKKRPPRKQTPEERAHRKETFRKLRESGKMSEIVKRRKATLQRKYGADNTMHIQSIKDKVAKTNMKKYGSRSPMGNKDVRKRAEKTLNERYGVDHSAFESKEVQDKARKTMYERYGGTGVAVPEIKEKVKKTNLKKYGVEWATQIPEAREKAKESYRRKYGVDNVFSSPEIQKRMYDNMMSKYGVGWPQQVPEIREKTFETIAHMDTTPKRVSLINRNTAEAIRTAIPGVETKFEPALGSVGNADILATFKDRSVLIDMNPTITHNSLVPFICILHGCGPNCTKHSPIDEDYHYRRSCEARKLDLKYAQFYEWDSIDDVVNWVSGRLEDYEDTYSARKLDCRRISQKTANAFLKDQHVQGAASGQKYCYALEDNGRIVAVGTFGKPRFNRHYDWEWIRYSVRDHVQIHGGQGALFKQFLADVGGSPSVISYVDFNHTSSAKTFLDSLGFKQADDTGPTLVWSKENDKVPETSLVRQGADRLIGTSYGRPEECGLDNHQIMMKEGWLPVYTSGNRVYVYESD